jgi:hypothetical protein
MTTAQFPPTLGAKSPGARPIAQSAAPQTLNCTSPKIAAPTLKTISAPHACANPMGWQDRQAGYLFHRQNVAENTNQISDAGYSIREFKKPINRTVLQATPSEGNHFARWV